MAGTTKQRRVIKIGTRKSKLAMVQAESVRDILKQEYSNFDFELVSVVTAGDRNKQTPLHQFGAKSLWTLDLEYLLLNHEVDLIVHCLKDMPTTLPPGCIIGSILEREDPRDAVVMKRGLPYKSLEELPAGSVLGTSSVRRGAQVARHFPQLVLQDMRGNIDTRLSKLDNPELPYTCLLLASAGLIRLGLEDRIVAKPSWPTHLYAVGQGALCIEIRENDPELADLVSVLTHEPTKLACLAERAVMRTLEGGCSVPIGVETEFKDNGLSLRLRASVSSVDGKDHIALEEEADVTSPLAAEDFGRRVAALLLQSGAGTILQGIVRSTEASEQAAIVAKKEDTVVQEMQQKVDADAST